MQKLNILTKKVVESLAKCEVTRDTASYFIFMKKQSKTAFPSPAYIASDSFDPTYIQKDSF